MPPLVWAKVIKGLRWKEGERALHLLRAWSSHHRLCLGQVVVDEKSNEITAIPRLIDLLELKGTIVTTDALNTQKNVVSAIVEKGEGYVLLVKGNHPGLLEEIELLFKEADACGFRGLDAAQFDTVEKSAGRVEERHYALLDGLDLLSLKEWQGACCVGRVIRRRTKDKKTSLETTYYITSGDQGPTSKGPTEVCLVTSGNKNDRSKCSDIAHSMQRIMTRGCDALH